MRQPEMHVGKEVDNRKPLTLAQQRVLERAVAKVVLIGAEVGVSADQMILLLQSGFTVRELLEYLAAQDRYSA